MSHFWTRKFLSRPGKKRAPRPITLSTNAAGVTLSAGSDGATMIAWDQVKRMVAFKRDVYAYDMICLLIELVPRGVVEVNESMPGWKELVHAVETQLPGAKPYAEWFMPVTFPAFETSPVDIFKRV